ncbi:MAG: DUF1571 domain-containing protein [Thiobacillus sp.]|nr:DUF1571 domain-containing protein [Thiobacillus sp.]
MLAATLTAAALAPLAAAIKHYRSVETYRVTLHSTHDDGEEEIRYAYKKPGFVRMEFIRPHEGAVLVYSPITQRVRLWPFGIGHFPEIKLSPGNPLVQNPHGQTVDQSDVGTLFEHVRILLEQGDAAVQDEARIENRTVLHLVTGAPGVVVAGVHRYELWLDTASQFPVKVISRDQADAIIETVTLDDLEINLALPDGLFNPE